MSLLTLPNELLYAIVDYLTLNDFNSFLKTNRVLNHIFTPLLHDFALQDRGGMPALCWAACQGHYYLAKLLLEKGVDVDTPHPIKKTTALSFAATVGNLPIARLLLEKGATVNYLDKRGFSPLLWAARNGNIKLCELLIKNGGADVNLWAPGQTDTELSRPALHLAVIASHYSQSLPLVKLLLENGARVNEINQGGATAIIEAASYYKTPIDIHKILIEAGADVNFQVQRTISYYISGQTAFHKAVYNLDLIKLLIDSGINPMLESENGDTALDLAISTPNYSIIECATKAAKNKERDADSV